MAGVTRYDRKGRRIGAPPVEALPLERLNVEAVRRPKMERDMVMAHPIRRAILAAFADDGNLRASALDLLQRPHIQKAVGAHRGPLSTLTYHCNFLKKAGVLEVVEAVAVRGAVKSIMGPTEFGRAFLVRPESLLDQMAAVVRERGQDAYPELVDLLGSSGRNLGDD